MPETTVTCPRCDRQHTIPAHWAGRIHACDACLDALHEEHMTWWRGATDGRRK